MNILKMTFITCILTYNVLSHSQTVKMYNTVPNHEELGKNIFNKTQNIKMRSISFGKADNDLNIIKNEEPLLIGLPIKFKSASYQISKESEKFLNEIGKMLTMPIFINETLVIEGHTDAKGSIQYNQILSENRALSVKNYLINKYNIDKNRLISVGYGETKPLKPTDPYDKINRRVQFHK